MTTMTIHHTARITSTKGSNPQFDLITAALRRAPCLCFSEDCAPYIVRGGRDSACVAASSTTLLAMAKRGFVTLDKCGARIVGAYVTDLGRRWQLREATAKAYAERTARIVEGR